MMLNQQPTISICPKFDEFSFETAFGNVNGFLYLSKKHQAALTLLENLLYWGRSESERLSITPENVVMKEVVKDAEVLRLLEEDEDDFEEFEEGAYDSNPPPKIEAKQWREDWDDEDINEDFTKQLKK